MLSSLGAGARFAWLLSVALMLGFSELVLISPRVTRHIVELDFRRRVFRCALAALAAGLAEFAVRSLELQDFSNSAGADLLTRTRFGHVWLVEQGALAMLAIGAAGSRDARPSRAVVSSVMTGAALLASPLASHSAAAEEPIFAIAVHGAHLVSMALWIGGVLALAAIAWSYEGPLGPLLAAFSRIAPLLVALAVGSGITLATWHVASWPRLLATTYGGLLIGKLVLLAAALVAAAELRLRWLREPGLEATSTWTRVRRSLAVECSFAASAVAVAATMAQTIPGAHAVVSWWLPFRFSVRATWGEPGVAPRVLAGIGIALLYGAVALGRISRRDWRRGAAIGAAGTAFAAAVSLPPLAVKAYPGTYWTPDVRYDAASVANGRRLFRDKCVSCHGLAGRGDGPEGKSLPKRPANLTEPHTAFHTAGDMFWWLAYGIPESGMPPFDFLAPQARWDLIDFLRAFAAGYQARLLGPGVSPGRPWLAAVDFQFTTNAGDSASLRDFRGHAAVLLVLFSPGSSDARLARLREELPMLRSLGAEVIAVPIAPCETPLLPLQIGSDDARDVVDSYVLFRRTFAEPGNERDDDVPSHLEFLIDRFGYLRARWRPDVDRRGWDDSAFLADQLRSLAAERLGPPPPDDHVH